MRIGALREFLEAAIAAAILALFVRTFLVQAWAVPSPSMEDTLLVGDQILINRYVFGPRAGGALGPNRALRRGDVVVFRHPEDPRRDVVKRVAALPGETVEIAAGRLIVDGEARPLPPSARPAAESYGPLRVPAGSFFALGDNQADSGDSRRFGPVPLESVRGRALLVYWSFVEERRRGPLGWWRATRWSRLFTPVR
ncbi:MAG TPA: signal peptidase I [Thermoanaerobaculia bacterium]|jgi:signal peptidase I